MYPILNKGKKKSVLWLKLTGLAFWY